MEAFCEQAEPAQGGRDDALLSEMELEATRAAEQATHHRVEAERYERIARAALAAARTLADASPVEAVTLERLTDSPPAGRASTYRNGPQSPTL